MSIVLPPESCEGIQLGPESRPTFGWRDILGQIDVYTVGANDPTFVAYTGTGFKAWKFSETLMNEVYIVYHVPHDYLPGSNLHFHVHYQSTNVATKNRAPNFYL